MSCSQAVIVLAFNEHERLNFAQLKETTGLSEAELKRQLVSLTMADHQILINKEESKESKTLKASGGVIKRTITEDDVFEVNSNFSARLKKIAINTL